MAHLLQTAVLSLFLMTALSLVTARAQDNRGSGSSQSSSLQNVPSQVSGGPTVVTVTATPLPIDVAPADVSATRVALAEKLDIHDPADLFGLIRGLHVSQALPFGPATLYQLGADPNFCLVLLDGIPLNDPNDIFGGAVDVSSLDLANVGRVETVSGPLSAVYGSQALSGVVNIISRQHTPDEPTTADVELAGGSFGLVRAMGRSTGRLLGWDYTTSFAHQRVGEQVERDEQQLEAASFRADRAISPATFVTSVLHIFRRQSSGFPPTSGGPEFAIIRNPEHRTYANFAGGFDAIHQFSKTLETSFGVNVLHSGKRFDTPAILDAVPPGPLALPPIVGNSSYWRVQPKARLDWRVRPSLHAISTFDPVFERGERTSTIAKASPDSYVLIRHQFFGSSELIWMRDKWTGVGAVSLTATSDGAVATPRIAGSFGLSDHLRLRTGFGLGFKLPSFFALGDQLVGNPKLRPERSQSVDGGIEWHTVRGTRASLTYVHARYTDLIDFSAEMFRLVNRQAAVVNAALLEVTQAIGSSLDVGGNLTYSLSRLEGTSEPLRNRPRWRASARAGWRPTTRLSVAAEGQFVGRRFDFALPRPDINSAAGYSVIGVAANYRVENRAELFVRLHNVLNERFQEFIGFPSSGIFVEAGIRWQLLRRPAKHK